MAILKFQQKAPTAILGPINMTLHPNSEEFFQMLLRSNMEADRVDSLIILSLVVEREKK